MMAGNDTTLVSLPACFYSFFISILSGQYLKGEYKMGKLSSMLYTWMSSGEK